MNKLLILFMVLVLTGCETTHPTVISAPIVHPNLPPALQLRPIVFKAIVTTNDTYLALDAHNYENLSKNWEDTAEYLTKLRLIIYTYRNPEIITNKVETTNSVSKIEKKSWFKRIFK